MVGPWGEEQGKRSQDARRGPDGDLVWLQGERSQDARQETRIPGVLPLGGKPRGGTESTRETLSRTDKDLNKAYFRYKKKRLRKKGKLFEEKEEASLYTGIITLLINPDNVTGKQEKQNENETRKEQAKKGDRNAQENRDGKQKRGKTRIAEHTPTRNRTEADENETGDRARRTRKVQESRRQGNETGQGRTRRGEETEMGDRSADWNRSANTLATCETLRLGITSRSATGIGDCEEVEA
ncbi:hypothetical protein DFP73DRAFT_599704 [Morchella snyderi]|nr:hypothetical protein DFP73DRAFT_599704 [Morchella snyderi]